MSWTGLFYDPLRALHIISVIFWMAGMLYLPRLFVYHHTAQKGGELESSLLTQERKLLKVIINPAMLATWTFGILLIFANAERANGWSIFASPWWSAKFLLVLAMSGVHGFYAGAQKKFARGERPLSERRWRMLNEIPALMTIAIVLVAVVWLR